MYVSIPFLTHINTHMYRMRIDIPHEVEDYHKWWYNSGIWTRYKILIWSDTFMYIKRSITNGGTTMAETHPIHV